MRNHPTKIILEKNDAIWNLKDFPIFRLNNQKTSWGVYHVSTIQKYTIVEAIILILKNSSEKIWKLRQDVKSTHAKIYEWATVNIACMEMSSIPPK